MKQRLRRNFCTALETIIRLRSFNYAATMNVKVCAVVVRSMLLCLCIRRRTNFDGFRNCTKSETKTFSLWRTASPECRLLIANDDGKLQWAEFETLLRQVHEMWRRNFANIDFLCLRESSLDRFFLHNASYCSQASMSREFAPLDATSDASWNLERILKSYYATSTLITFQQLKHKTFIY